MWLMALQEEEKTSEMGAHREKAMWGHRRWPSASQRERPQEKQNLQHLDLWLSASRTVRKLISVVETPQSGLFCFVLFFCHGSLSRPRQVDFQSQSQVSSTNGDNHRLYLNGLVWGSQEMKSVKSWASAWHRERAPHSWGIDFTITTHPFLKCIIWGPEKLNHSSKSLSIWQARLGSQDPQGQHLREWDWWPCYQYLMLSSSFPLQQLPIHFSFLTSV